ncbi:MAG TPA: tetratricopeptide repeat protein [Polyangia bacterium]|nr:tetratricopeptide repeat protein [Polyangia bacterium]
MSKPDDRRDRAGSAPTLPVPLVPSGEPGPGGPPLFEPGDQVGGRYWVIAFLARGGMGEIYEAEDLELHERVALKTVRPELARVGYSTERFKREIQLARRVTHRNVCRIFDVGFHDRDGVKIAFLTMELLAGETLARRLSRSGRISTPEALPLVGQMALGLEAAHRVGIVHSDFKSENVVLVPQGPGAVRVVVTDFGLARATAPTESHARVSLRGEPAGTPAYMAPEQVEGGPVGVATDIYALGVVLYEMVTGAWPFIGDTPISTAAMRLHEPPPPPRSRVPELDPQWEAVILRCLQREPAQRFASAAEVATALGFVGAGAGAGPGAGGSEATTVNLAERRSRRRKRWLAGLGLAALALTVAALGGWKAVRVHRQSAAGAPTSGRARSRIPRRTVAVVGFKNMSGRSDVAWLSTALSEMLSAELAAGEHLRTIPEENVARMRLELPLADVDSLARDTLARIRTDLGADLVVAGSYLVLAGQLGGKIRVDVRLQDAVAGETVGSVTESGPEAELLEVVARTGARVRARLGAADLSAAEAGALRAALPSTSEAARLLAQGRARLSVPDAVGARDLLAQAVAQDPQNPLAHAALAGAWSMLGHEGKARAAAQRAYDLSGSLSREDQLSVEARFRETTRDFSRAVQIYQTLFGFFPDNLEYGLHLARAQDNAGKAKDALGTLDALRKLPPPDGLDPRIDLEESLAAEALSDSKRVQAAAARAAERGRARGARLLVAQARLNEGLGYWQLGQPKQALAAYDEARQIFTEMGYRVGVARVLNDTALVLWQQGDFAGTASLYAQALAIHRDIGNHGDVARTLQNMALVMTQQGDLAKARAWFEDALATYREIDDQSSQAGVEQNIATVLVSQGQLTEARKRFGQALEHLRALGERASVATVQFNLGDLELKQGDPAAAERRFDEALAGFRELGQKSRVAFTLYGLGELLVARGQLQAARKRHDEALAMRVELGEKGAAAESRLALAALSIEDGQAAQAEPPLRAALAEFQAQKAVDDEAMAEATLARALAALGRHTEALEAIERAGALAKKSESRDVRFGVGIAAARVRARPGEVAAAQKQLESVLEEAGRLGFVAAQLEARLALGELQAKSGERAPARTRLLALEREARGRGFGLIARKAAAAARW